MNTLTIGTMFGQSTTTNMARQILTYSLLILVFGVAVPYWKGLGFLDPALLGAYACLGTVFAGPAAAQAFENKPASLAQGFRSVGLAVAFGEGISVAMLACGLATLYITRSKMLTFPPDLSGLALPEAMGLGLSARGRVDGCLGGRAVLPDLRQNGPAPCFYGVAGSILSSRQLASAGVLEQGAAITLLCRPVCSPGFFGSWRDV